MSASESKLERARHLMMAALDDEITPEERQELDALLQRDETLRAEWQELTHVKEATSMLAYPQPPDDVWDTYWTSVYNRLERGIAWILVSVGTVILAGWAGWEVIQAIAADSEIPLFAKVSMLAVVLGIVILFVSVVREKLRVRAHDPFKEVKR